MSWVINRSFRVIYFITRSVASRHDLVKVVDKIHLHVQRSVYLVFQYIVQVMDISLILVPMFSGSETESLLIH